jgi:WD40 repeat protein
MAHYNGATLWFPNTAAAPEVFAWKGSHLDVTLSPDGRFLVTSMQENTLHGWRLSDGKDMQMSGYPTKARSLSWSPDGYWLATSGADGCIVWPFNSKEGPMGKAPRECAVRKSVVSRVAFHPKALIVAVGYEDGWVMLSRLTDAAEILVRSHRQGAGQDGAISALAWNATGDQLLFGTAEGGGGLLSLPKQ